ncbi:MAG: hypothetical protein GDA56_11005 [Hormoscilla sp. GM7CHS1pb]|nr:hypothetical protein [Hormoscilla sp. GM7CHS1pb]
MQARFHLPPQIPRVVAGWRCQVQTIDRRKTVVASATRQHYDKTERQEKKRKKAMAAPPTGFDHTRSGVVKSS